MIEENLAQVQACAVLGKLAHKLRFRFQCVVSFPQIFDLLTSEFKRCALPAGRKSPEGTRGKDHLTHHKPKRLVLVCAGYYIDYTRRLEQNDLELASIRQR